MQCEICGKEFAEADEEKLVLHMKSEHPAASDQSVMLDEASVESSDESGRQEIDRDQLEAAQRRSR